MSETHKLDTLPVEIIRRIASHGPCESNLSLLKVNRALQSACNDRLVFKSIIDNGNGSISDLPIWKCTLPLDYPVTLWARYALADSKACIMPRDASAAGGDRWNDFADVVPQLMASHHPFLSHASAANLIEGIEANSQTPAQFQHAQASYPLTFSLAARTMAPNIFMSIPIGRGGHSFHWKPLWDEQYRILQHYLFSIPLDDELSSSDDNSVNGSTHVRATKALYVLSYELRWAIVNNRIHRPGPLGDGRREALIDPPNALDIPFSSLMDLPLPFSANAARELEVCHLAKMTSAGFLEDGEWVGYYVYPFSHSVSRRPHFDPPMRRINFITSAHPTSPNRLNLRARGIDAIGPFEIEGALDRETGKATMSKRYADENGGWDWDWSCVMTPFGFVGSWGKEFHPAGWFWLWKESWSKTD